MVYVDQINIPNKYGLLMEPKAISPGIYEWIKNNNHLFKNIITYDKELLLTISNAIFYPHCGCWIKREDQIIYQKNKLLSIIASSKTTTNGHRLRHEAITLLNNNNIDITTLGNGYNKIDYKLEGLKDYCFSIVIENSQKDYYFTEKLIDSFVTGTIPIYWGCPSIGDFFNLNGMIIFNDIDDLLFKIKDISFEKYQNMLPYIKENFDKAKEYLICEDWLYKNTKIFK
jgi:hypothetical protein